jgi:chromosome partitioning protein
MNKKTPPQKEKLPPKVIAVVGRKGGVGKTTTATNVGAELASRGYQVLLCDMDLQGDATTALTKEEYDMTTGQVLLNRGGLLPALLQTAEPTLWLLPTDDEQLSFTRQLVETRPEDFRFALRDVLEAEAGGFDYIIIDCPPSLENTTLIALCAATHYLAPALPAVFSLKGLKKLSELTDAIKETPGMNADLQFLGVFFTAYNPKKRSNLHSTVVSAAEKLFPGKVLTNVREDQAIGRAQNDGIPAQRTVPESNAVVDFSRLTDQILAQF